MKQCPTCGVTKSKSEFGKNSSATDGLFYQCKECKRAYDRQLYAKKREIILAQKKKEYHDKHDFFLEYNRAYDKKRRERALRLKTPCVKCGESRLYVIDYHHIDPKTKLYTVNQVIHCKVGKDEIKKCVCLCRNCHTEYHHLYGNRPEHPIETLTEYIGKNPYSLIPQF